MTKGSSPVIVENGGKKTDGNVATPVAKKRGFFSNSFRRRRSSDIKINDTIIINENVVFNGNNKDGIKGTENGKSATTNVTEEHVVNDKKPPLQQKQPDKKAVVAAAVVQQQAVDGKQQQQDKKKTVTTEDKKKAVTKRGNRKISSIFLHNRYLIHYMLYNYFNLI